MEITPKSFPRIIFMGTPEFAVASLDALVKAGYAVVAVVTAPDKPAGRGMQLQQSAVKKYALAHQIPVLQPEKLKNPEFLGSLRSLNADLQVVVAFRMLPELVWSMPPMGTVNVHGSLLPQYRGAAPINWAVINGETQTGVTTFKLQHAIDTGDILLRQTLEIGPNETAGELHDKMMAAGAGLLVKTIEGLVSGGLVPQPQTNFNGISSLKHAPKIFTPDCKINPAKTAAEVHNLVRGLSPFPGAFTTLDGKMLKVFRSVPATGNYPLPGPGRFISDGKKHLLLGCSDGWLELLELQLEGKKRMDAQAFLAGYRTGDNSEIKVEI